MFFKWKWATKKKCSQESKSHTDKLRILNFIDEEVMNAGTKSRLIKMVLRKLSSGDYDTPEGKKKLRQMHEFLMSTPVENSLIDS